MLIIGESRGENCKERRKGKISEQKMKKDEREGIQRKAEIASSMREHKDG